MRIAYRKTGRTRIRLSSGLRPAASSRTHPALLNS
ncbi:hypothetical protein XHC_1978 [Xanthomonas hortorum pv. carotae str. M081]|nr:hypothetical protein XHC_1978 [Xanthomonas hortorum pv. carotae str. M081]